jgi:hypothetical protein
VRPTIKYLSYTFELFLSSGVPYLQFEYLLFKFHEQCTEFDANGDLVIGHELIIGQPVKETGFADGSVADYN